MCHANGKKAGTEPCLLGRIARSRRRAGSRNRVYFLGAAALSAAALSAAILSAAALSAAAACVLAAILSAVALSLDGLAIAWPHLAGIAPPCRRLSCRQRPSCRRRCLSALAASWSAAFFNAAAALAGVGTSSLALSFFMSPAGAVTHPSSFRLSSHTQLFTARSRRGVAAGARGRSLGGCASGSSRRDAAIALKFNGVERFVPGDALPKRPSPFAADNPPHGKTTRWSEYVRAFGRALPYTKACPAVEDDYAAISMARPFSTVTSIARVSGNREGRRRERRCVCGSGDRSVKHGESGSAEPDYAPSRGCPSGHSGTVVR